MDKKGTILGLMMATCIGLTGCLGNAEDEIADTEHNLDISDIADFSLNKFETVPTMKPQVIEIKKSEDISEDIKEDIKERGINIPEPNITILGQEEIGTTEARVANEIADEPEIGTTEARVANEIVDELEIGTTEAGVAGEIADELEIGTTEARVANEIADEPEIGTTEVRVAGEIADEIKILVSKKDDIDIISIIPEPDIVIVGLDDEPIIEIEDKNIVEYYTVKEGDSLWDIASERLGDKNRYMELYENNKDILEDPNKIFSGQILRLFN